MSDALTAIREREYPDPPPGIFLNTASWGLLPRSSADAVADLTHRRTRVHGFDESELGGMQRRCRRALASLLQVDEEEIALVPNTSYGVNLGAALVGAGEPGTVVLSQGEFPANVLPWKALEDHGFRVETVPADAAGRPREDALLERLEAPGVRALAVSAVQFATGYRMDLARLGEACRDRGVLFVVDAIQALGVVPLHPAELHVDLLASGGQKWLCAPWGSGFAWIPRRHHARFEPPMVSWLSMEGALELDGASNERRRWLPDARKYELGTNGVQDYLGLGLSTEVLLECSVPAVREHVLDLHAPVLAWLRSRDDAELVTPEAEERRGGILTFAPPRLEDSCRALEEGGVAFARRGGGIRLAPHLYNTREEMERVVEILDGAARRA